MLLLLMLGAARGATADVGLGGRTRVAGFVQGKARQGRRGFGRVAAKEVALGGGRLRRGLQVKGRVGEWGGLVGLNIVDRSFFKLQLTVHFLR